MKIFSFTIFLLISMFPMYAQESEQTDRFEFGAWTETDKIGFVFGHVGNVHLSPDQGSEVSGKINIGTKVQILEVSDEKFTQNGITSPWIKIKTSTVTGYIWGGILTNEVLKLKDGKLVLWGLIEIKKSNEEEKTHASVRIVHRGGALIAKHDFVVKNAGQPNVGYLTVQSTPLLDSVQNVIVFETPSEACGVFASMTYFLYSQNQLQYVGSGYAMGDGGVLHTSLTFEFPYPEKEYQDYHFLPSKGHIFSIQDNGGYDDDCIWEETIKVIDYNWNGSELVKVCEQ